MFSLKVHTKDGDVVWSVSKFDSPPVCVDTIHWLTICALVTDCSVVEAASDGGECSGPDYSASVIGVCITCLFSDGSDSLGAYESCGSVDVCCSCDVTV